MPLTHNLRRGQQLPRAEQDALCVGLPPPFPLLQAVLNYRPTHHDLITGRVPRPSQLVLGAIGVQNMAVSQCSAADNCVRTTARAEISRMAVREQNLQAPQGLHVPTRAQLLTDLSSSASEVTGRKQPDAIAVERKERMGLTALITTSPGDAAAIVASEAAKQRVVAIADQQHTLTCSLGHTTVQFKAGASKNSRVHTAADVPYLNRDGISGAELAEYNVLVAVDCTTMTTSGNDPNATYIDLLDDVCCRIIADSGNDGQQAANRLQQFVGSTIGGVLDARFFPASASKSAKALMRELDVPPHVQRQAYIMVLRSKEAAQAVESGEVLYLATHQTSIKIVALRKHPKGDLSTLEQQQAWQQLGLELQIRGNPAEVTAADLLAVLTSLGGNLATGGTALQKFAEKHAEARGASVVECLRSATEQRQERPITRFSGHGGHSYSMPNIELSAVTEIVHTAHPGSSGPLYVACAETRPRVDQHGVRHYPTNGGKVYLLPEGWASYSATLVGAGSDPSSTTFEFGTLRPAQGVWDALQLDQSDKCKPYWHIGLAYGIAEYGDPARGVRELPAQLPTKAVLRKLVSRIAYYVLTEPEPLPLRPASQDTEAAPNDPAVRNLLDLLDSSSEDEGDTMDANAGTADGTGDGTGDGERHRKLARLGNDGDISASGDQME